MTRLRVINKSRDSVLGCRIELAESWWRRARGFVACAEPRPGEGLLLSPCRGVHMRGMRFPLDIVLLDRRGRVLAARQDVPPGPQVVWRWGACHVLELPAGTIRASGTQLHDVVVWKPLDEGQAVGG